MAPQLWFPERRLQRLQDRGTVLQQPPRRRRCRLLFRQRWLSSMVTAVMAVKAAASLPDPRRWHIRLQCT
jgi:hypothetical protein